MIDSSNIPEDTIESLRRKITDLQVENERLRIIIKDYIKDNLNDNSKPVTDEFIKSVEDDNDCSKTLHHIFEKDKKVPKEE